MKEREKMANNIKQVKKKKTKNRIDRNDKLNRNDKLKRKRQK